MYDFIEIRFFLTIKMKIAYSTETLLSLKILDTFSRLNIDFMKISIYRRNTIKFIFKSFK